jgi:tetratricopeptide (TPR) repeat protein
MKSSLIQFLRLPSFQAASLALLLFGCQEQRPATETEEAAQMDAATLSTEAAYTGSEVCAGCHADQYQAWQHSHHDLALQAATPETVLARVTDPVDGTVFTAGDRGINISPEPGMVLAPRFTFGVGPLQQYVVDGGNGAWQTYPIAWDSREVTSGGQRWYNLNDAVYPPGDPMHWRGRANRWNSQCADCHSTGVSKGYDPETRSYQTKFEVEDVGCEACHGPGSRHAADPGAAGLLRMAAQAEQINACAACHSRRSQIAEGFRPDGAFLDHYSPRLISTDLYYVDGQILDEVYVWGSFLSSRMHQRGVTCSNCHDPHTAGLRRPGNETCTFCHQAEPPSEFASAGAAEYDSPRHHFHPEGSAGAQCVACHMPSRTYMGVDDRRDHSFRIPRPDLSAQLGVPEPCTGCHTDRDAQWAAGVIESRFGTDRPGHFAAAFAAADAAEPGADEALAALVQDPDAPIMVRASALARLGIYNRGYTLDAIRQARKGDPLLRFAAPLAAASLSPERAWRLLEPLLVDELRAVRHQAVSALLPTLQADPTYRARLAPYLDSWLEDQQLNLDYPETQTNIAGAHIAMGNIAEAESALRESLTLQASWVPGLVLLADLYRATGRDPAAGPLLEEALALSPDQPEVSYAYALWLSRQGRLEDALPQLERAARMSPEQRQYAYTWAVALNSAGESERAIDQLKRLLDRWPDDPDILLAAITMLRDQQRFSEALPYLDRLIQQRPGDQELIRFRKEMQRAAEAA